MEPSRDIVVNPPDKEWKEETMRYLKRWTGTNLEYGEEDALIKLEIDDISPHQVDEIVGDGHCFFRAISKAITGTQSYHADFRKAVVEWMLCEDHPQELAQYIAPLNTVSDSDCQSAIQKYIDERHMSLDGWGGDRNSCPFHHVPDCHLCVHQFPWWEKVELLLTNFFR